MDKWQFWLLVGGIVAVAAVIVVPLHIRQRRLANATSAGSVGSLDNASGYSRDDIKVDFSTRDIVYGGVALAMSFVLGLFPIFSLPNGGDISLAAPLPILLYSYFFGFKKGLIVAVAHMLLRISNSPYIVTPMSAVLDYVVPSLALSLAGILDFSPKTEKLTGMKVHSKFFIGLALYTVVRTISHIWAGAVFWNTGVSFGGWSGDLTGFDAWSFSTVFNLAYIVPETLIIILASYGVFKSSALVRAISKR
jgi:thiamine transporter